MPLFNELGFEVVATDTGVEPFGVVAGILPGLSVGVEGVEKVSWNLKIIFLIPLPSLHPLTLSEQPLGPYPPHPVLMLVEA